MEFRDIEYFTVVAQHCHLGRAAEALGLSQPALSKSLRRLETELGAKLVRRTPKGVELSAEGHALLVRSRELQLSMQNITQEIRDVGSGGVGHIRIGAGPTSTVEMLVPSLLSVVETMHKTMLKVVVSDNDLMYPALRNGDLDLIVNYPPRAVPRDGLVEEELYEEEFVVVASATHRLAGGKEIRLEDLTNERWALSAPTLLAQQLLRRTFMERGLPPPQVVLETRYLWLRLQVVAASQLLDFTSRSVFKQAQKSFKLKELPVKELAWRRPVSIVYREGAYLSPAVRRFIASIRATARQR